MTTDKGAPATAASYERAETKPMQVRLDSLHMQIDTFAHRDVEELSPVGVKDLMESIAAEGLQVPIEFFADGEGRHVLLRGHRRVTSMRLLAERDAPGFSLDMLIEALEVVGAARQVLLVRSLLDNVGRREISIKRKIMAAKLLADAGVPPERAALALGCSVKTYQRLLRIARVPWMLAYVAAGIVGYIHASNLLEVAERGDRLRVLKERLDEWVAAKKKEAALQEKLRRVQGGKAPAKGVKCELDGRLAAHWIALMRQGKRLEEKAPWSFSAGYEPRTGRVMIRPLTLDVNSCSSEELVLVAARMSQLAKELLPLAQTRRMAEEADLPDPGEVVGRQVYDLELLRSQGFGGVADRLRDEYEALMGQPGPEPEDPEEEYTGADSLREPDGEGEDEPDGPAAERDDGTNPPAAG